MKKLISFIMLAASFALSFADEPRLTIQNAANAAPENTEIFLALDISKKYLGDCLSQKGAAEFAAAIIDNPAVQKMLDIAFEDAPEELKDKISAKTFSELLKKALKNPEDCFLAMAATDFKEDDCDLKFVIFKHPLIAQKTGEILEQGNGLEKSQKDGASFFKSEDVAIAIKGALIVLADDENAAAKAIENLESPRKDSFAATEKFRKLMSLEKDPVVAGLVNCKSSSDGLIDDALFAFSAENPQKSSGVIIIERGEKSLKDPNDIKNWDAMLKRSLAKGSLLKNSMANSTLAMSVAIPEITDEMEDEILSGMDGDPIENKIITSAIKNSGIKSFHLSLGELDANTILNMGETMEAPEAFLKIDAADADEFFKNEKIAFILDQPLFAPITLDGDTIYALGMYNLKIAQTSKTAAAVSTIKDIKKFMSLAKGSGNSLAGSEDAKKLLARLPEGNAVELFMDIKALSDFSKAITSIAHGESGKGNKSFEQNFLDQYQNAVSKMCKKCLLAAGFKFVPDGIVITVKSDAEYDYELGEKLVKEIK